MTPTLLASGLRVTFPRLDGSPVDVVRSLDFEIAPGEIIGLVGESGSGKTMLGLSLMNLVPRPGMRHANRLQLDGTDILNLTPRETQRLRGARIGMVFQDPMSSFNPVRTIGSSVIEAVRRHTDLSSDAARQLAIKALDETGVPSPEVRIDAYPHQLSGGLRQRAMIAMASINNPSLLIADEPTTALDATIQAQILDLLRDKLGDKAMIMITHDLGVAANLCDRIMVMKHGQFVETGTVNKVLGSPEHEYTKALIDAIPSFSKPYPSARNRQLEAAPKPSEALLEARDLKVSFKVKDKTIKAVDGVNIQVNPGETVGLVGESGSGKSTLISTLIGIHKPGSGSVRFDGRPVSEQTRDQRMQMRRRLQMVFQDPYSSLNPRWTIEQIIAEPMIAHGIGTREQRSKRIAELIDLVGLPEDTLRRRAAQFSGGQRQRIAIARALAAEPDILIADEPVSALDVSMQAQIVALLNDIQKKMNVGILIVAHDLALMHHIADRIVVMNKGQIVEEGPAAELCANPKEAYTAQLIAATPDPHRPKRREQTLKV